jgi:hypothetical protein
MTALEKKCCTRHIILVAALVIYATSPVTISKQSQSIYISVRCNSATETLRYFSLPSLPLGADPATMVVSECVCCFTIHKYCFELTFDFFFHDSVLSLGGGNGVTVGGMTV